MARPVSSAWSSAEIARVAGVPSVTPARSRDQGPLSVSTGPRVLSSISPIRVSRFFITFNTNYRPDSDFQANFYAADLNQAVRAAFETQGTMWYPPSYIVNNMSPHPPQGAAGIIRDRVRGTVNPAQIVSMRFEEVQSEIAPRTGFLHAHAVFVVTHRIQKAPRQRGGDTRRRRSGILLDPKTLRDYVRAYATTGPVAALAYVHINGYSSKEDLEDYINKGEIVDNSMGFKDFVERGQRLQNIAGQIVG